MKSNTFLLLVLIIAVLGSLTYSAAVYAAEPVIHAVLFFSPSCPHCHKVITQDLPPIVDQYQQQLNILVVNTYSEEGNQLYMSAVETFEIPAERFGVPTLIVGEHVLVGSLEIPDQLPGIIESGLINGGIDWPDIPGLLELIENELPNSPAQEPPEASEMEADPVEPEDKETDTEILAAEPGELKPKGLEEINSGVSLEQDFNKMALSPNEMSVSDRFMTDPTGNSLSVLLLFGMAAAVAGSFTRLRRRDGNTRIYPFWVIPVLLLVGTVVAVYMAYVEVNQRDAVCGPVGDCNTVQQSVYAYLFGIIPIGVLGVLGYLAIGFVWILIISGPSYMRNISTMVLWGLALFGTLFSIYLTILEPFVIGATCAWCLSSALIMTFLLWVSTPLFMQSRSGLSNK